MKLKKSKSNPNITSLKLQELSLYLNDKIKLIQLIINDTCVSINTINKIDTIFSSNDIHLTNSILIDLLDKTHIIQSDIIHLKDTSETDNLLDGMQEIINKLAVIISGFGTNKLSHILFICFGNEFQMSEYTDPILKDKFSLINQYVIFTGYKIINWKSNVQKYSDDDCYCCNKTSDDIILIEECNNLECFITDDTSNSFFQNTNSIRFSIHNEKLKKTLSINGVVNETPVDCMINKYIYHRKNELISMSKSYSRIEKELISRLTYSLSLKEYLIYGNEDIYKKMIKIITEVKNIKQTKLDQSIKQFLELNKTDQRELLINLLIYNQDPELKYICSLLYDLISTQSLDNNENNDSNNIYNSLPYKIQEYFKETIKHTISYKQEILNKYDVSKVGLEQQIYLLKVNDNVKEKAITKLKEITGKPDELCFKTKQYLEGLIKIPFGSYKHEPILKVMDDINLLFNKLISNIQYNFNDFIIIKKNKYTNVEINNYITTYKNFLSNNMISKIEILLDTQNIKYLSKLIKQINTIKKNNHQTKIQYTNTNKPTLISRIIEYFNENNNVLLSFILKTYDSIKPRNIYQVTNTLNEITNINSKINKIENTMEDINTTLDSSIYSHSLAKKQIMKIIGQWMNGEQSGYCFGFEGSPGIGKTSLAKKGLTNCLKDANNNSRPFAFIALGGSTNGSSLEGHGYTYMNSTWGKIVDILMETKCMNPIIYIDELDKVSKTEQGKEIIGILTHLIDPTQNDCFQDKYFTGIDIDLSKALFIFSYNDAEQIDKILLDRIHRIKFDNLSLQDKVVIVNKFILPEINQKMGFDNVVELNNNIIKYIIENYTLEPGVRKLKEILFDLYGEINLNILKRNNVEIPIVIDEDNIENIYLTKYNKIYAKKIHNNNEIGIINGLWANSLGIGGITPIQTLFYPSSIFLDLQLTGLQGDVMKESMNVAKSLAWNLINDVTKKEWLEYFSTTKCQGLHIHCPEGGISKDGPSAGAAITTAIYSLLTKKPIKNNIGITGEINLNGEITAIGGLEYKIDGGIKAGITTFLYPKSNNRDFNEWKKKNTIDNNIIFIGISNINDVFNHVFI